MCFTRRKSNHKKKLKKNKIKPYVYHENIQKITTEEFLKECIICFNCKKMFNLEQNEIKINCAGCDKFFHCGIAGKCVGKNCVHKLGNLTHQLSWCNNCVSNNEFNILNKNNDKCICKQCE